MTRNEFRGGGDGGDGGGFSGGQGGDRPSGGGNFPTDEEPF